MSQDKHLIIEKDGYPLQIESIQTLNDGIQQSLTNIATVCGSNTILKGCVDEVKEGVTYVSDGIMCIDGRIFQFKGGKKTGGVTIITDKVDDIYDTGDGSAKKMLPVRGFSYVTNTPQGSTNIAWDSFVRVSDLRTISEELNTFKEGLNGVKGDVELLQRSMVLAKGVRKQKFNAEEGNWFFQSFDIQVNTSDYVVFVEIVDDFPLLNGQPNQRPVYFKSVTKYDRGSFGVYVEKTSGMDVNVELQYLVVKL